MYSARKALARKPEEVEDDNMTSVYRCMPMIDLDFELLPRDVTGPLQEAFGERC